MAEFDAQDMSLDEQLSRLNVSKAELYYAITLLADDDSKIIFETPTHWTGWSDTEQRHELRKARPVYPAYATLFWDGENLPFAFIHDAHEAVLFLLGGGNALVEKDLAENMFSVFLEPDVSIPYGPAGYRDRSFFPNSAFKRAPTPKLRMAVLNRDGRRCRICGRSPDNHVDVELHVHHIRPWAGGGVTDISNLITLCHTCHNGLMPHEDRSLFSYVHSEGSDDSDFKRVTFLREVANYRRVGFFSGTGFSTTTLDNIR